MTTARLGEKESFPSIFIPIGPFFDVVEMHMGVPLTPSLLVGGPDGTLLVHVSPHRRS